MALWGESGFALMTCAACQTSSSTTCAAHCSAPVKFGMRPRAPGKRATVFDCSSLQTASLISCLVTDNNYLMGEDRSRKASSEENSSFTLEIRAKAATLQKRKGGAALTLQATPSSGRGPAPILP